jgi:hypothetical protein
VSQLLLQYLFSDEEEEGEEEEGKKSIFVRFVRTKNKTDRRIENRDEKRRKEGRCRTHRELFDRCRSNVDARHGGHDLLYGRERDDNVRAVKANILFSGALKKEVKSTSNPKTRKPAYPARLKVQKFSKRKRIHIMYNIE